MFAKHVKHILGILQVRLSRYQWANMWIKYVELPYTNRWKSVAGNCLRSQIHGKRLGNWTPLDLSNNWTSETKPNFQLHITSLDELQPSIWIQKRPWLTGYCWHSTRRQRDCMICESAKTQRCLNKWTYIDLITYCWWKTIMHQLIGTLLGRSPYPHYQGMLESMIFSFSLGWDTNSIATSASDLGPFSGWLPWKGNHFPGAMLNLGGGVRDPFKWLLSDQSNYNRRWSFVTYSIPHMLHGNGIFSYMYHQFYSNPFM